MHQAALHEGIDPDRLSFTRSLRVVRRQVPAQAALSPRRLARALTRTLAEITDRLLPERHRRTCPRVIKRKMSNWPLKRAQHRHPPRHQSRPSRSPSRPRPPRPDGKITKSPVLGLDVLTTSVVDGGLVAEGGRLARQRVEVGGVFGCVSLGIVALRWRPAPCRRAAG